MDKWRAGAVAQLLAALCCLGAVPARAELTCAADRLVIRPGERVHLQVWAGAAGAEPLPLAAAMNWHVPGGRVLGHGPGIEWQLPAAEGKALWLEAVVEADADQCRIAVLLAPRGSGNVVPGSSRGDLLTARRLWISGSDEPPGYGAYAYLLLASPPLESERERHLAVLVAFLRQFSDAAELERYVEKGKLNLMMLPLRYAPRLPLNLRTASDAQLRSAAQALLAAYDYARAEVLLARLVKAPHGSGPYVLTRTLPMAAAGASLSMFEDMNAVDASLAEAWMRWSMRLATAPRAWNGDTLAVLALQLRNVIAHAARAVPYPPDLAEALPRWVTLAPAAGK
jgi:hypothetical protein